MTPAAGARLSHLISRTLRQAPAEAETVSHRLLLRAGMIYPGASGVYSYLPLGWRAFKKVENIVREEMDRAGGQEVLLPGLQPRELWQETGRDIAFGPTMFSIEDRRQRRLVLGPTHEEVVAQIARSAVRSYRDLPILVYQIQTKFRDEPRPRGGLLRGREFSMKDLYSLDTDDAGLDHSYQVMIDAYRRIYERCHLPVVLVEADSGAIGGKESHEFTTLTPTGEDEIIHCPACGYAANLEKAQSRKGEHPTEPLLPLEEVATPGIKTIDDLSRFLGIPTSRTLKAVFYSADGRVVFTAIRGDLEINEVKLKNLLKCHELRLSTEEEVAGAGLVAGSASPLGLKGIPTVGDESIALGANLVAGANREGYHVRNVNYPRDFQVDTLADIAAAAAGQGCPRCSAPLRAERGIEVGHVFKLGTFISQRLGATYLDREGVSRPVIMGSYGIGVGRLLAAIVELHHDDRGITWPLGIAPYQVYLCPLAGDSAQVSEVAEQLYHELLRAGVEVLYDDREESPGVKFNDADLIGIPLRLVLSQRTLAKGSAEVKWRTERQPHLLPIEGLAAQVRALLAQGETQPLAKRGQSDNASAEVRSQYNRGEGTLATVRCDKCSYTNEPGAKFCNQCGAVLKRPCPRCGAANAPGSGFCKSCGHELVSPSPESEQVSSTTDTQASRKKICPACHTVNEASSLYCYNCGVALPSQTIAGIGATGNPAGFSIRAAACAIDIILITVFAALVRILLLDAEAGEVWPEVSGVSLGSVILFSAVLAVGYFTFAIGRWGQTIGKAMLGLKVTRMDSTGLTYTRSFARYWAYYLATIPLLIGFIMIALTSHKRGLHDYICDTRVVKLVR